jgi:hypothetical protein
MYSALVVGKNGFDSIGIIFDYNQISTPHHPSQIPSKRLRLLEAKLDGVKASIRS